MSFWKMVLAVALGGILAVGGLVGYQKWSARSGRLAQETAAFVMLEAACWQAQGETDLLGLAACARDCRRIEENASFRRFWAAATRLKAACTRRGPSRSSATPTGSCATA